MARALRDAGMEVIYWGAHQTPEQIIETALQEDADAVGLWVLTAAHLTLVPRVIDGLRTREARPRPGRRRQEHRSPRTDVDELRALRGRGGLHSRRSDVRDRRVPRERAGCARGLARSAHFPSAGKVGDPGREGSGSCSQGGVHFAVVGRGRSTARASPRDASAPGRAMRAATSEPAVAAKHIQGGDLRRRGEHAVHRPDRSARQRAGRCARDRAGERALWGEPRGDPCGEPHR